MSVTAASAREEAAPALSESLLRQFDAPGPRYTSYPTADRFVEAYGEPALRQALQQRARGGIGAGAAPLSVYVHIPFCESVCYYCACNKVITRHHERATEYLDALDAEIALHVAALGPGQAVSQLHLGGGSPTFLSDAELERLLGALGRAFRLQPNAEVSIEVDPRTASPERLRRWAALGVNRLSFGVQDFDLAVQRAGHRVQPFELVRELVDAARREGFASINVDLIYGLPKQSRTTFTRTLDLVIGARPDRIAAYSYAHLPHLFKPQRQIKVADLITPAEKLGLLGLTVEKLTAAGYVYVGMDHFALPTDELVSAQRAGTLQRNFQGYSTRAECDLVALGVSSIAKVGDAYAQNAKTLPEYYRMIDAGTLAVQRGVELTRDDTIRRDVIQRLMCATRLDFEAVEARFGIRFEDYFAGELGAIVALERDGLVERVGRGLCITPRGRLLMHNVAMVFDAHLPQAAAASDAAPRFSRAV
jgi:oxygen-independent coproporphyrinogen-3 oxidase